MKIVPVFPVPDLAGTKVLSPAGTPTFLGDKLSGHPCSNVQEKGFLFSLNLETAYVNQGSKTAATAAATTTAAATKQKQKMVQEIPLNLKKRSAVSLKGSSSIYLVLPSYAERHRAKIKEIITSESKIVLQQLLQQHFHCLLK